MRGGLAGYRVVVGRMWGYQRLGGNQGRGGRRRPDEEMICKSSGLTVILCLQAIYIEVLPGGGINTNTQSLYTNTVEECSDKFL